MAYTFEVLKHKTVAELKEIAAGLEHEAVKGYTQLNKEHLLKALCVALEIDAHIHHEVKGLDKSSIKSKIRALKKERDQAIAAHDVSALKSIRGRIRNLKKDLRKAMV